MSVSLVERAAKLGDEIFEVVDSVVDIVALAAQRGDSLAATVDGHAALGLAMVAEVIEVEQLAYIGEAETHPFATQDPDQPGAIAFAVQPGGAAALGRNQILIFVE